MSIDIQVVDDPAQVCADMLTAAAASGEDIVLTGGTNPKHAYELAASGSPAKWAGAKIWLSDDRCVEPDHELSNYAMIKATLLDGLERAGVQVDYCRRILGERGPEEGALEYERELEHVGGGPGGIHFGLVLLGIGPDTHICSMFPGQDSLNERSRMAVGVPVAGMEPFVPRVTLTFPALSRATRVLLMATGEDKAHAIATAFADDAPSSNDVPASLLKEHVEEITLLLDEAAASRL
jgi:6-phosphogluconolactonase